MKNILFSLLTMVSIAQVGVADTVPNLGDTSIPQLHKVNVKSAQADLTFSRGPIYNVKATAVFSNSCVAPRPNEIFQTVVSGINSRDLKISLFSSSNRMCPMVYRPVSKTFDLGQFTSPSDRPFDKIFVNGVEAKIVRN